ncbi:MAG: hypothetical protein ACTHN5_08175 [Phycisphaerae bacterium]
MSEAPLQSSLEYQAPPTPTDLPRQTARLLLIPIAVLFLEAIHCFGCDLFLTIQTPALAHPLHLQWTYTLFSLQEWREFPLGVAISSAIYLASAGMFLLAAHGIRRRKRWPIILGICLCILWTALVLLSIGSLLWMTLLPTSSGASLTYLRLSVRSFLLTTAIGTIMPPLTLKLTKLLKIPPQ